MKQKNKAYPNDFKTKFGFFTISWVHGFATMVFSDRKSTRLNSSHT